MVRSFVRNHGPSRSAKTAPQSSKALSPDSSRHNPNQPAKRRHEINNPGGGSDVACDVFPALRAQTFIYFYFFRYSNTNATSGCNVCVYAHTARHNFRPKRLRSRTRLGNFHGDRQRFHTPGSLFCIVYNISAQFIHSPTSTRSVAVGRHSRRGVSFEGIPDAEPIYYTNLSSRGQAFPLDYSHVDIKYRL